MKRLLTILLLLSLAALPACGLFGPGEEETCEITACLGPDPGELDPQIRGEERDAYSLHLFEGLMKYVPDTAPAGDDANMLGVTLAPGQADSYDVSEDGLTYDFRLRDDIFWSDGSPVTAGDFVLAWQRLVDPANDHPDSRLLAGVVAGASAILAGEAEPSSLAVAAPDDKTFTVTLERPFPRFPELTARPALFPLPAAAVKEWGEEWAGPEHIVVNGAFRPDLWQEGSLKLVRNEYYYDAENIGPDALTFLFKDTEAEILQLFENEQCGFIQGFPTAAAAELAAAGLCFDLPRPGECVLQFNCERLPDWRLRAAVALAVDKEALARDVLRGGQTPAPSLTDPFILNDDGTPFRQSGDDVMYAMLSAAYPEADLASVEGRQALALQLLQQAQAAGFDASAPLKLISSQGAAPQAVADAVRDGVYAVLGLTVEVVQLEPQALDQALNSGDFDLARLVWQDEYAKPLFYLDAFTVESAYNFARWNSPSYDSLLARAKAAAGADRDALLHQAEQALFKAGAFPCLPLYDFGCQYAMAGLTGAAYAPGVGFLFHQARLLPEEEEE